MEQQPQDSSPYNACSTLLSMDCQPIDQHSASKVPINANLHHTNLNKASTSCVSSNVDDDQQGEQMEENAHSGMLQGSVIFDMLSAMQFNSHSSAATIPHDEQTNTNYLTSINASFLKANHDGPQPPYHGLNLHNSNQANQDHLESGYLFTKDTMHRSSAQPSGLDPISTFLKLPVLADPTKLELGDQRLLSSYSSHYNSYKEDAYAATTLGNNNNWFNSLQLETIRPEYSLVNDDDDMEDEGHIVHYLDHTNIEGASQEAKLLMKLNGEEGAIHAHGTDKVLGERYNSSTMNMFSNYHNEDQLLYSINEGGDAQRGRGDAMFDNMQMMLMGYNEDARDNGEYGVTKGSASSSVVVGANVPVKTGRRRGVRGTSKNSEERETQRMTHIAVERNRRRQMNEHLRVLRALMPPSYIQRGDQASIIGGAIEFVRELEQLLQCLESQKRRRMMANPPSMQLPTGYEHISDNQQVHHQPQQPESTLEHQLDIQDGDLQNAGQMHEEVAQAKSAMADIEVKVVERSEALIKILSQRRPRQLLHMIVALQDHFHFSILHTNVTTIDNTVLYSFTVKISNEHGCSANQIATSMHEVFVEIISQLPMKSL